MTRERLLLLGICLLIAGAGLSLWRMLGDEEGPRLTSGESAGDRTETASAAEAEPAGRARRRAAAVDLGRAAFARATIDDLTRTATLRGRLVDARRGDDVEGGEVLLVSTLGESVAETRSDEEGVFQFAAPPGDYRLLARQGELGALPMTIPDLATGEERDLGPILLLATDRLEGRVVDETGRGLSSARVELFLHEPMTKAGGFDFIAAVQMLFETPGALVETRTDEDGHFAFRGLPWGEYVLRAEAEGRGRVTSDPQRVDARQARSRVELQLKEGASLRGKVVDAATREPLAGATIAILPDSRGLPEVVLTQKCVSGEDGRFVFRGLAPMRYHVFARKEGRAPAPVQSREATTKDEELVIAMPTSVTVAGRVFDESTGRGVAGVRVVGMPQDAPALIESRSDAEGRFRIEGIASGSDLLVFVRHAEWFLSADETLRGDAPPGLGVFEVEKDRLEAGLQDLEVPLQRGGSIRGRVLRARDGTPLADAEVRVTLAERSGPLTFAFGRPPAGARTDAEGRYEIVAVAPGRMRVLARHPEHAHRREEIEEALRGRGPAIEVPGGGEVTDVELRLEPRPRLRGRVVDRAGRPVPAAEVTLVPGRASAFLDQVFGPDARQRAVSDTEGRFELRDAVAGGVSQLVAAHPDFPGGGELKVDEAGRDELEITLRRGARVRGTLLAPDGRPLSGVGLRLRRDDVPRGRGPSQGEAPAERTDRGGRFAFAPVAPGPHRLELVRTEPAGLIRREDAKLELAEDEERELRIQLVQRVEVRAVVVDAAGRPRGGVAVRLIGEGVDRKAKSDAEGRIRFEGLEPGIPMKMIARDFRRKGGAAPAYRPAVLQGVVGGASEYRIVLQGED